MAQQFVRTEAEMRAWKQGKAKEAADPDVILIKPSNGGAVGGRATLDTVRAHLKAASKEIQEAAMDGLTTAAKNGNAMVPFVISDDTQDRDGDVIEPDKWDLTQYAKNNVLLWSHNHDLPAIGNGVGTHVDGNSVLQVGVFASPDVNPYGAMIGRMYQEGILRACSVGFIPKVWAFDSDLGEMSVRFQGQELIENSPCNVGSNRNALAQARSVGISIAPAIELIERSLDGEDLLRVARPDLEETWKALVPGKSFSIGALVESLTSERDARVAAERKAARQPPTINWAGVVADLAKGMRPSALKRLVTAHTFGKSEADQAQAEETAAVQQIIQAADQPDPQSQTKAEDQPAPLPAETVAHDTNVPAGATVEDVSEVATDVLAKLFGHKETK